MQAQKSTLCVIPFSWNLRTGKSNLPAVKEVTQRFVMVCGNWLEEKHKGIFLGQRKCSLSWLGWWLCACALSSKFITEHLHACASQLTVRETQMDAWGVWLSQRPRGRENGLPPRGTTQWFLSIRRGVVPRPRPTRIPKSADDFGILSRSSASMDVGPMDTTCRLD